MLFSAGIETPRQVLGVANSTLIVSRFGRGNFETLPFFVTSGEIK
jgi:hypothetical protein